MTRKGPEGSNPSPGAYFEEPSTSLKALAGESSVEEVTTTKDGLTANRTEQKEPMTTAVDTSSNSRLQAHYSSPLSQKEDEIIAADSSIDGVLSSSPNSATVSCYRFNTITARWRNRFHHPRYVKKGTKYKTANASAY